MKKEINLVIVSGRTIVVRSIENITNREISGCTSMMRQTLLTYGSAVIFEHFQQEVPEGEDHAPAVAVDIIKEAIQKKREIRILTDREMLAIERVRYRA